MKMPIAETYAMIISNLMHMAQTQPILTGLCGIWIIGGIVYGFHYFWRKIEEDWTRSKAVCKLRTSDIQAVYASTPAKEAHDHAK